MPTLLLGTSAPGGAQLLRLGVGVQQRALALPAGAAPDGADVPLDLTPYPVAPAGETGVCVFCGVDVTVECAEGVTLRVIPYIDDVPLPEQRFTRQGAGTFVISAPFRARGTRATARIQTVAAPGAVAVLAMQTAYVALRATPQ